MATLVQQLSSYTLVCTAVRAHVYRGARDGPCLHAIGRTSRDINASKPRVIIGLGWSSCLRTPRLLPKNVLVQGENTVQYLTGTLYSYDCALSTSLLVVNRGTEVRSACICCVYNGKRSKAAHNNRNARGVGLHLRPLQAPGICNTCTTAVVL